jgi:hypothetical protein
MVLNMHYFNGLLKAMLWNELGLGLGVAIIFNGVVAMTLLDIIMFSSMNLVPERTRLVISKDRSRSSFSLVSEETNATRASSCTNIS